MTRADAAPPDAPDRPLRFDLLTIFPAMLGPVLATSIPGRAAEAGAAEYHVHDVRDWTRDRHGKVDDRPFGGGPGMVMTCQPLWDAVQAVEAMDDRPALRILPSPQGRRLDQRLVEELATRPRLLLIAGHYEGIDERVVEALEPLEVSLGDYVLSGGELASLVVLDAVVRLLPGVLGHEDSAAEDSFAARPIDLSGLPSEGAAGRHPSGGTNRTGGLAFRRLLDCPHYTRPRVWQGREVPEVLLGGDHQAIAAWRTERMLERTRARRPDLLEDRTPRGGDAGDAPAAD